MTSRGIIAVLAVAAFLGVIVTPAHADRRHGHHTKYRRTVTCVEHRPARVVYHDSCNGSAFAGFVGGVVLGAVLSNVAHADNAPRYYFYDPYCGIRFSSLDGCNPHVAHSAHPRVIQVVEYQSGRCVESYHWQDRRWHGSGYEYDED